MTLENRRGMNRSMRRVARVLIASALLTGASVGLASVGLGASISIAQTGDRPTARTPDPTQPASPTGTPPAQQVLTDADRERRSHVIARVGEVSITVGEVEDQIARQSPFMRARYRDPVQLRDLVQNMLRFELLSREAERQGFGSDPEVRQATAQSAVQQLVRERFDEQITPETVPADDVRAYYEAHPEEFSRPEMRRASHVLVESRERAEALREQARAADARTFRQLAQQHSLDAETRARGGDLRYFDDTGHSPTPADPVVDAAIVRAAFALGEVGDVSEPIEVSGQWTIVKLTGRRPAEHRSLEDAGPSIRLRLWRERRQAAIDTFVEGLRERASVEVHYDRMRPIHIDPPDRVSEDDEHAAPPEGDEAALPGHPAEEGAAEAPTGEPSPEE